MMMQMADGIGVNCGYCHNSRAFADWSQSTPARWVAYYGIRMVQDLNRNFMLKLSGIVPMQRTLVHAQRIPVIPDRQSGVQGANGFVVCATCHYGRPQPLGGAAMAREYPGLTDAKAVSAPAASVASPAQHASAAAAPPT